jgi:hypothetical protein
MALARIIAAFLLMTVSALGQEVHYSLGDDRIGKAADFDHPRIGDREVAGRRVEPSAAIAEHVRIEPRFDMWPRGERRFRPQRGDVGGMHVAARPDRGGSRAAIAQEPENLSLDRRSGSGRTARAARLSLRRPHRHAGERRAGPAHADRLIGRGLNLLATTGRDRGADFRDGQTGEVLESTARRQPGA